MTDCVAIAHELPFRQQVVELAAHLSRSLPNATDHTAVREFITTFDSQLVPDDEQAELSEEEKKAVVRNVVKKFSELRGGLEGVKEIEPESAHLLLQYLLSSNFDVETAEYQEMAKSVVEGVKRGGEAAVSAGRLTRAEAACRILNNTYNHYPPSSPLRPPTLFALISLLNTLSDLPSLPLSPTLLSTALSQWSIPDTEKVAFLSSASAIYESARSFSKALELHVLALGLSVDTKVVEKALVLAIAVEDRFNLDEVLRVQGVKDGITGTLGELVKLFTGVDELEAVKQGQEWLSSNRSYLEGFGIKQLTAETVLRKLRLIALTTLCARSTTKQLQYSEVASTLAIDQSDVEAWVIDAIRANLLKARLSQLLSTIRIQSVSSAGTRRFGSDEWSLLERRLGEWKKSVAEARAVVDEAEGLAAQGLVAHQRPPRRREEEVAA